MTQPVPSTPYGGAIVEPEPNQENSEEVKSAVVAPLTPMSGDSNSTPGSNAPATAPKEPAKTEDGVKIGGGTTSQAAPNATPSAPNTSTAAADQQKK